MYRDVFQAHERKAGKYYGLESCPATAELGWRTHKGSGDRNCSKIPNTGQLEKNSRTPEPYIQTVFIPPADSVRLVHNLF